MANSEFCLNTNSDKHIEDVIDARKKIGQYDIQKHPTRTNIFESSLCRNSHSLPTTGLSEESRHVDTEQRFTWVHEGDMCNFPGEPGVTNVSQTDSEITVVRVKREGLQYRTDENKWNLNDVAVPGDGSHLGESPSLVNLVTLVGQSIQTHENNMVNNNKPKIMDEYLVPLSSWDPYENPHNLPDVFLYHNRNCLKQLDESQIQPQKQPSIDSSKRTGLAGRLSRFLRKRCFRKLKAVVNDVSS